MNVEYYKWYSHALGREMELKLYGHGGKPVLVFPSSGGRFHDFEDRGMIDACASFIDSGEIRMLAVDSYDHQSWLNQEIPPRERAARHEAYEQYILREVIPFCQNHTRWFSPVITTGCSMGAYHAANFFFRHPRSIDTVIALSGLYGPYHLLGDYMDEVLYHYFPLLYLPGLNDSNYLEQYRKSKIILCVGQGDWEKCDQYDCIGETRALKDILWSKNVPCWADFWGEDVHHEWDWWRKQLPYFLEHLDL